VLLRADRIGSHARHDVQAQNLLASCQLRSASPSADADEAMHW
jgi:hypothetical protein